MYSVVVATMLTAGTASPTWFFKHHGCHGCHGCWGYACSGCWGGSCWGGWGCSGCSGCWWGCHGCWSSASCWGCGGYGYGCYSCSSCTSCFTGCGTYSWGCSGCVSYGYGCTGCWSGCCAYYPGVPVAAAPAAPAHASAPASTALVAGQSASPARQRATVLIKAPLEMTIKVNGEVLSRSQAEQTFASPELEAGASYVYEVTAETKEDGKPFSRTQRVRVQAGAKSEVDFTREMTASARVTVHLPEEARLYVDGVPCPLTSAVRSFNTPPLENGQTYAYTLKATLSQDGQTFEESQRITLQAGKEVKVEFDQLKVKTTVRR